MKYPSFTKSILVSLALLTITACSSTNEQTKTTEKSAAQVKSVPISISGDIDKSGRAEPIKNGGMVVGYKYKRAFMIPAMTGNYFGFSYTAKQSLTLNAEDKMAKSDVKSSVPVTVKVTHPEMKQANGQVSTESSWQDTLYFGRPNHTIWQFESKNELLDGKWTMTVIYEGKTIVEKNFLVKTPPPMPKKLTQVCSADESLYPAPLAKAHQACCTQNEAQACFTFAWKGVELLRDNVGAVLYYGRGCELGDASSCRAAGQKSSDDKAKHNWFEKGCKLKDFDSCLEIGKTSY